MLVLMVLSIETYKTYMHILKKEVYMNETSSEVKVSNVMNEIIVAKLEDKKEEKESENLENTVKHENKVITTTKKEENIKTIENPSSEIKKQETPITPMISTIETPVVSELEKIRKDTRSLGTFGRLYLPSVNLNVALYKTEISTGNEVQKIVDNKDSAAYFSVYTHKIIADHSHQSFHKIEDIPVGEKAYIKKNDSEVMVYKLVQRFEGINAGSDLTDLNGKSIFDEKENLIMYTCYKISEYENHVIITIWNLESNS